MPTTTMVKLTEIIQLPTTIGEQARNSNVSTISPMPLSTTTNENTMIIIGDNKTIIDIYSGNNDENDSIIILSTALLTS
jgi:hypothetical protein